MRRALVVLVSLLALAIPAAAASGGAAKPAVGAGSSSYGRILFDTRGYVLYAFTRDARGPSRCGGDCTKAWPPYVVSGRPVAGPGAKASLIGTTRRTDGRLQATYGGRPLYYYVGDRRPGEIRCQNVGEFGGVWLVVRPSGALAR